MGGLLSRSIEVDLVKLWECGLYWTVLTGPQDVIVNAELNNASIIDACRLSRAATKVFAHNDPRELRIEH